MSQRSVSKRQAQKARQTVKPTGDAAMDASSAKSGRLPQVRRPVTSSVAHNNGGARTITPSASPAARRPQSVQRRRYQRPQRRWRRYALYGALILGVIIVSLGVVAFATTGDHPLRAVARVARSVGLPAPGGGQQQAIAQARPAIVAATAASLRLSSDQLTADLNAGQTIPQIAQAQQVPLSQVNMAYLNAVKAQLDSAVRQGSISASQESQVYQFVQNAVAQGKYPFLTQNAAGGPGGLGGNLGGSLGGFNSATA